MGQKKRSHIHPETGKPAALEQGPQHSEKLPLSQETRSAPAIRRARLRSDALSPRDVPMLQRSLGNRTVSSLVMQRQRQPAMTVTPHSQPVVQRVGGEKFGIKVDDKIEGEDKDLLGVKGIVEEYREEIREKKKKAIGAFKKKDDILEQTKYSKALSEAEMTVVELKKRLETKGFILGDDNVVRAKPEKENEKGKPIVKILSGDEAYEETGKKSKQQPQSVYKRHTLKGLSKGEYIKVHGRMLRRYAFRGITPLEVQQINNKEAMIKPLYATDKERESPQSGMHFRPNTGTGHHRPKNQAKLDTDYIEGLKSKKNEDKKDLVYAFAQARKGVGKFFSLRSTPRDITSNHGESFSSGGEIRLDLAKVDPKDFVFHYAGGGVDKLDAIETPGLDDWETDRAKESLLRNREIILRQYPLEAIAEFKKKPNFPDAERQGYNDAYYGKKADFILDETKDAYEKGYNRRTLEIKALGGRDGYDAGYWNQKIWYRGGYQYHKVYCQAYKSAYQNGREKGIEVWENGRDIGYQTAKNGRKFNDYGGDSIYKDGYAFGYDLGCAYKLGFEAGNKKRKKQYKSWWKSAHYQAYDSGYKDGEGK